MHCGDDDLLAYLDGELSGVRGLRLRRHLKTCWPCRTRLAKCEEQIHRLSIAMDEEPFPDSKWAKDAKQRLSQGMMAIDSEFERSSVQRGSNWLLRAALAGGGLAVCVVTWFVWTQQRGVSFRPPEVIARVAAAERNILSNPVHQTFAVEIAEIQPARRSVTAELEIWSDGPNGKYVSRLKSGGGLKQALWRPSSDSEFVYLAASKRPRVRQIHQHQGSEALTSLGDGGIEPAQLEAAFLGWLETRAWRPISFASHFAVWSGKDGTVAKAEQIRLEGGGSAVRITAVRQSARLMAIMTLEVDSQTYRPRLQTISFEQSGRKVEFSLRPTAIRTIASSDVAAAMSSPELNLSELRIVPSATPARGDLLARGRTPMELQEDPEPLSQEIAAHYVLHLAGACLGEPVRVAEESGTARVWRLNGDSAAQAGGPGTEARLENVLAVLSDLRSDAFADSKVAGSGDQAQPMTQALQHARAIQRLAIRFPAVRVEGLPAGSRALLESMVRDHAAAVGREVGVQGLPSSVKRARNAQAMNWQVAAPELAGAVAQLSKTDAQSEAPDSSTRSVQQALGRLDQALRRSTSR